MQEKSIPSLDGLRAISVFFVVIGHVYLLMNTGRNYKFFIYQDLGVSLFFVISGYLITKILMHEIEKSGGINFRNFFIKRVFRIFPAYYFFLLVTWLAAPIFKVNFSCQDIVSSVFYLGYYYPPHLHSVWAHSWSLAIEEQFYIGWPFVLNFLRNKRNVLIFCFLCFAISPLLRVATYSFTELYKHKYHFLLHSRIDTLMFGCLLAYYEDSSVFSKFRKLFIKKSFFALSLIYLLICYPILNFYFGGSFRATLGYSLEGFFIVAILIHVIEVRDTFYYRILNSRPLVHIGSISYGIYLWQQPFTYVTQVASFPINLLYIYLAALISYGLVEYPMMRLRSNFLK